MRSEGAFIQGITSDSSRRPSAREACALTTMPPPPFYDMETIKCNSCYDIRLITTADGTEQETDGTEEQSAYTTGFDCESRIFLS